MPIPALVVFQMMLGLVAMIGVAHADWPTYGRRLSDNDVSIQSKPTIASDGQGGAFVAWNNETEDAQNPSIRDVYIQHITASGDIAPGWPTRGIPLELKPADQFVEAICADGRGGVIVIWRDYTNGLDLYASRIEPSGAGAPGWPAGGLPICTAPGGQGNASLVPDGAGGALITWDDYRYQQYLGEPFGVRILGDGSIAPGWPANGRLLLGDGNSSGSTTFSDNDGGAIVLTGMSDGEHILRMDLNGVPRPGWPADGVVAIPSSVVSHSYNARYVSDGLGGAFLLWADWRSMPPPFDPYTYFDYLDIYGVHMQGDGTLDPAWPSTGLPICTVPLQQDIPDAMPDGQGGVYVVWEDVRNYSTTYGDIYGQHLNGDGTMVPGWTANGSAVLSSYGFDGISDVLPFPTRLAPDGAGGFWEGSWDKYGAGTRVQHMNSNGTFASGFTAFGQRVPATTYGGQADMVITPDGAGNAIVAWSDGYVYAQRVGNNVVTATAMALMTSEAYPDHVGLVWQGSGVTAVSVERRSETEEWRELARLTPDHEGFVRYEDRAVTAGTRYDYRLRYAGESGSATSAETWVTVPAQFELALAGAHPNPTRATDGVIAFTLPDASPARLELLDVTGRRLLRRDVGALGAGRQSVRLSEAGPLPPGLYWARLTRPDRTLTSRIVVID